METYILISILWTAAAAFVWIYLDVLSLHKTPSAKQAIFLLLLAGPVGWALLVISVVVGLICSIYGWLE